MSILSSPQGRPERIYSLYRARVVAPVDIATPQLRPFLNPGFTDDGEVVSMKADLLSNVFGAAQVFELSELANSTNETPLTYDAFLDHLHTVLAALPADHLDSVLLRTYAFFVVKSESESSTSWLDDYKQGIEDQISAALMRRSDDAKAMNPTKFLAWRQWMVALGLMVSNPRPNAMEILDVTRRLRREVLKPGFAEADEMSARDFINRVARAMPYLDGGAFFLEASQSLSLTPKQGIVSRVLSYALQDLHSDGVISLDLRGDQSGICHLKGDDLHERQSFVDVRVLRPA